MTLIDTAQAQANVLLASVSGDTIDGDTAQTIAHVYSFHNPMGVMPLFANGTSLFMLDLDQFLGEIQMIITQNWLKEDTERATNELFGLYCFVREHQMSKAA